MIDPWYTKKSWAEISKSALINNLDVIRSHTKATGTLVAPVVKANAYGHGDKLIVPILEDAGVTHLCVATIDEAIALRQLGAKSDILIFGTTRCEHVPFLKHYRLTPSICSVSEIRGFADESIKAGGAPLPVHIKLDTGMSRFGLLVDTRHKVETVEAMLAIAREPSLMVTGVYTHLATADCDLGYVSMQREHFISTISSAESFGFPRVKRHFASSAAIPGQPENHFDMVRPGIALYGGMAGPRVPHWTHLRPVMTVKSVIEEIDDVVAGTRVSYGGTWAAPRDSRLAVINMGYADGLSRQLSNKGCFYHKGREIPIVGRVCMDRCVVDITEVTDARVRDEVMLFGEDQYGRKDASDITAIYGTIDYELFTGIKERVPRILVEDQ
ncbi:MAG TPA: alanine racemase [Clostridiaceae bacterium]|nr:alanine racemase [Clostridiaceae bacterium]